MTQRNAHLEQALADIAHKAEGWRIDEETLNLASAIDPIDCRLREIIANNSRSPLGHGLSGAYQMMVRDVRFFKRAAAENLLRHRQTRRWWRYHKGRDWFDNRLHRNVGVCIRDALAGIEQHPTVVIL